MGMYLLKKGTNVKVVNKDNYFVEHKLNKEYYIPKEAVILDPVKLYNSKRNKEKINATNNEIRIVELGSMIIDLNRVDDMKHPKWIKMHVNFENTEYL